MENDISLESLFRIVFRMHFNCIKKELEKRGLDQVSHPPILFILRNEANNAAVSQKEISDKLGVKPSTVAISIKRMENAGLLHKVADAKDQRINLITLTDKGKKLADESRLVFSQMDQGTFEGLTEDERIMLKTIFLHVIGNLEKMGAQTPELLAELK